MLASLAQLLLLCMCRFFCLSSLFLKTRSPCAFVLSFTKCFNLFFFFFYFLLFFLLDLVEKYPNTQYNDYKAAGKFTDSLWDLQHLVSEEHALSSSQDTQHHLAHDKDGIHCRDAEYLSDNYRIFTFFFFKEALWTRQEFLTLQLNSMTYHCVLKYFE